MRKFPSSTQLARGARFLAIFSVLLATGSLEAKLGDSPNACIKRYGTPTGDTHVPGLVPNGIMFQRGEYSITCGFENNVCTVVVVLRHVPDSPEVREIPRDDISLFMHENFGTLSWNYTRLSDLDNQWRTRNWNEMKSYEATFAPSLQMLTLRMSQ